MDRILIVDDDFELCSLVSEYSGARRIPRGSRLSMMEKPAAKGAERELPVMVLDVMLPGRAALMCYDAFARPLAFRCFC
jgi:DNA-binding response OmpR family regulator